jgi:hypothetical protein
VLLLSLLLLRLLLCQRLRVLILLLAVLRRL